MNHRLEHFFPEIQFSPSSLFSHLITDQLNEVNLLRRLQWQRNSNASTVARVLALVSEKSSSAVLFGAGLSVSGPVRLGSSTADSAAPCGRTATPEKNEVCSVVSSRLKPPGTGHSRTFSFECQPSVDRARIMTMAGLDFMQRAHNII